MRVNITQFGSGHVLSIQSFVTMLLMWKTSVSNFFKSCWCLCSPNIFWTDKRYHRQLDLKERYQRTFRPFIRELLWDVRFSKNTSPLKSVGSYTVRAQTRTWTVRQFCTRWLSFGPRASYQKDVQNCFSLIKSNVRKSLEKIRQLSCKKFFILRFNQEICLI